MKEHPSIALKILEKFSLRLEETEKLVGELSVKNTEARIAGYLLKLMDERETTTVLLPISKRDLAAHLGTTRETVSRRLTRFQTNGWIKLINRNEIEILNKNALISLP